MCCYGLSQSWKSLYNTAVYMINTCLREDWVKGSPPWDVYMASCDLTGLSLSRFFLNDPLKRTGLWPRNVATENSVGKWWIWNAKELASDSTTLQFTQTMQILRRSIQSFRQLSGHFNSWRLFRLLANFFVKGKISDSEFLEDLIFWAICLRKWTLTLKKLHIKRYNGFIPLKKT